MSDNGKVVKSGIWYTISSIAIRAVAIITSPIYTSMLTTGDYGLANTYNSLIEVFNIFTCLCVVYSIGRAKLDFEDEFDEYMSSLQSLSSSFAFVVLVFVTIFREYIASWLKYEVPLVIILFVYLCVYPSVDYTLQKCRYEYKYKENILISVITCIGTVVFSIVLMLLFNDKRYFGKILGTILPTFLMGIFCYIRILKKGKTFYNKEYWLYALKFGLPIIPHSLSLVLLAQMDRLMIKDICGNSDAGLYIYGYGFATLLAIFTNAIGQAWVPWFNEQLFAGNREGINKIQKKLVLLGIFLSIGFITVAPEALIVLAPNARDYWIAKWVIPPVALGTLAQYFYTNYVNLELYLKKTPIIAVSSVMAALVNFALNMYAIPKYGYVSASYTTLISYIFLMLFHFVMTRFILKEKVYSDAFMFIALALSICAGLLIMMFYTDGIANALKRYAVAIVMLGIFAFICRNDIMDLCAFIKKKYMHKS